MAAAPELEEPPPLPETTEKEPEEETALPELDLVLEDTGAEETEGRAATGEAAEPRSPTAAEGMVGEPAPLRDTTDVTAGLEEIDLADLVGDEPETPAAEEEIDIDALEEELFDLSDVLEEEEEESA